MNPDHKLESLKQAERRVISCLISDGGFLPEARAEHALKVKAEGLQAQDFYSQAHGLVFRVALRLHEQGRPSDTGSLVTELKADELAQIGGFQELLRIADAAPTSLYLAADISAIKSAANRRRINDLARRIVDSGTDDQTAVRLLRQAAELAQEAKKEAIGPLSKRPFVTWSMNQFLEYQVPDNQNMLGDGYLQRGQWTSVIGVGGLGKTRATLWLCICTILGQEWLGLETHCAGAKVLFLSTENGAVRWKNDLVKMTAGMTKEEKDKLNASLFILSLDGGTDEADADPSLNMSDPVAVGRLQATMAHVAPDIIVVDPLADMVGGDENSAEAMGDCLRAIRRCQRLAAPRAGGILIHHARTGAANVIQAGDNFNAGNFGRGSKALYSAVRCELQMAPGDKDDNTRIVLTCGKSNDAPKFAPRGVVFDPASFRYAVDPVWTIDEWRANVTGQASGMTLSDMLKAIRPLFSGLGCDVTKGQIEAALAHFDPSDTTLKRRLREAIKAGYLRTEGRGAYGLGLKSYNS